MGHIQSAMAILRQYADMQNHAPSEPSQSQHPLLPTKSSSLAAQGPSGSLDQMQYQSAPTGKESESATAGKAAQSTAAKGEIEEDVSSQLGALSSQPCCGTTDMGYGPGTCTCNTSDASSSMVLPKTAAGNSTGGTMRKGSDGSSQGFASTSLSTSVPQSDMTRQKSDGLGKKSLAALSTVEGSVASISLQRKGCEIDPRRLLDGKKRTALRVALEHGHDDMAAALHPGALADHGTT